MIEFIIGCLLGLILSVAALGDMLRKKAKTGDAVNANGTLYKITDVGDTTEKPTEKDNQHG